MAKKKAGKKPAKKIDKSVFIVIAIITVVVITIVMGTVLKNSANQGTCAADINNNSMPQNESTAAQLANPASVNCLEMGYRIEIKTNEDGSQSGYCVAYNGAECEEWAFYRGECIL